MRTFTGTNAADVMPVPLIVKLPRTVPPAAGIIDDRNVESIDILPTIVAVLRIELPWTVDGTSALEPSKRRREKKIYSGEARRVRAYLPDDLARERQMALDRQVAIFGPSVWPAPRLPGFETFIERSVASFTTTETAPGQAGWSAFIPPRAD